MNKDCMKTLAIIVTYNGLRWLDRCFGSLSRYGATVRTVVIDNGSTDGTVAAIQKRFPEVELISMGRNIGFGQANNMGLTMALEQGASHALLLNQDAWLAPGSLEHLLQISMEHQQFGILSPLHLNGSGDALDLQFSNYIIPNRCIGLYSDLVLGHTKRAPYPAAFVNAAAWLITAKCLHTVGGFNPSFFHYGEDDNYVARLHYHKLLLGIVAGTYVYHDRASRRVNQFMDDPDIRDARHLVLDYANPLSNKIPGKELASLHVNMAKQLLLGRMGSYRQVRRKIRLLNTSGLSEVMANKAISLQAGPSFL